MENKKDIKTAEELLRIRLSQMIINEKYKNGEFKIPIHLALGHEAIAVAVDSVMENHDQLVLTHRNIHYNLARTKLLKPELDEYFLKKEGLDHGQLGSMNMANEEKNIAYTSSILGNNLSIGAGLALAKKIDGSEGLVIVITGDGAMEEGTFYECLEFMKSNALSSLVIVENNKWSLATQIKERRCDISLQKFGESMDVKYEKLDSNDTYEYIERLAGLRKFALDNKTPVLIEAELTTLGGWHSDERFINYHAGPASKINLSDWPLIDNSAKDPVFVLQKYFGQNLLMEMSKGIFKKIKQEINELY
ncbi:MAG: thiamine pyrophosphate-dependent enzyme [Candidatus Staskawiczbacteria bacterium]|jgi:pyruvate dehydrogenase E1 component alpha subunit